MVNVPRLKGEITARNLTQKYVYEAIGLTKRQWDSRLEKKKFSSDEIYDICNIIGRECIPIFFEEKVT